MTVDTEEQAVANKERKQFALIENRYYRNIPDNEDYPHAGDVGIFGEEERTWRELPKCLDKVNHSPDGFAWGYAGSGPAQLAYALLFDVTNDEDKSQRFYQDYKWSVIAKLPREPWQITATSVWDWLDEAESSVTQAQ